MLLVWMSGIYSFIQRRLLTRSDMIQEGHWYGLERGMERRAASNSPCRLGDYVIIEMMYCHIQRHEIAGVCRHWW